MILLLIVHKGYDGMTLIGMGSHLPMDMDSGMADPKMVSGTRNSIEGRRH